MDDTPTVIDRQVVKIGDRRETRTVRVQIERQHEGVEVAIAELDAREVGFDLIAAVDDARSKLEDAGWLLCVQGARTNAQSSGMSRDMGGGEVMYLLEDGLLARLRQRLRPRELPPLVNVLDEAAPDGVGTLAQQREWYEAFINRQR